MAKSNLAVRGLLAGVACSLVFGVGCGSEPTDVSTSASPDIEIEPWQSSELVEPELASSPGVGDEIEDWWPVQDTDGQPRGHVLRDEIESRQSVMNENAREYADVLASEEMEDPEARATVMNALLAVHPLYVYNEDGSRVGYWLNGFVETDDYELVRREAEEYLASLR